MSNRLQGAPILVVGAGIMGAGIAQVAAQAGHPVMLFDAREGAAASAIDGVGKALARLVDKGRLKADAVAATLGRLTPVRALAEAGQAAVVIEAIVENLEVKRGLLKELESIVGEACVLASNTSSISITALANGLTHPGRLVGMHFFNPVPIMKLVEVISGLHTEKSVADDIFDLSTSWGKTAVHARSTPGFIVNRIARPFYAEALALLLEQAAQPASLDACMRAAGFRMGPCELMDLIGHDTNLAVTQSVFAANFGDKRYLPSLVQKDLVDGGLLGRKSGRGFYDYRKPAESPATPPQDEPVLPSSQSVVLHGQGPAVERWAQALEQAGRPFERRGASSFSGLQTERGVLAQTDGRPAAQVAAQTRHRNVVVYDRPVLAGADAPALAWSAAPGCDALWQQQAVAWLAAAGYVPHRIADAAGLVVARTLAMLINEAADAVHYGVCTQEGADAAMKLGVNYPAGPFEWLAGWSASEVVTLLEHLDALYRGDRYRVSPYLRQAAWAAQASS